MKEPSSSAGLLRSARLIPPNNANVVEQVLKSFVVVQRGLSLLLGHKALEVFVAGQLELICQTCCHHIFSSVWFLDCLMESVGISLVSPPQFDWDVFPK